MALLVTGAMGHVGREVVRQAAAAGATVIAQYRTTYRDSDARALGSNVQWVSCDLADAAAVERLCETHAIDSCIHSAAVPNEKYARPQPLTAINANIGATANLLDMARRKNWRRFLSVSTGSVFQNATDPAKPILEERLPSVTNIYSTTKYCGELLTAMYRSQFGLSAAVVRISWVYGPPLVTDDPPRGPVPAFLLPRSPASRSGCRAAPTSPRASPMSRMSRPGLIAAWRCETLNHGVYHLGSGENYTARVSPMRCAPPSGRRDRTRRGHRTMDDPYAHARPARRQPAARDAGFRVGYSLEDGVRAYADWMRANPELLA